MNHPEADPFFKLLDDELKDFQSMFRSMNIDGYKALHNEWRREAEIIDSVLRLAEDSFLHDYENFLLHDYAEVILQKKLEKPEMQSDLLLRLMHPAWDSIECGLIYYEAEDNSQSLIEMQALPINEILELEPYNTAKPMYYKEKLYSQSQTYFQLSLQAKQTPQLWANERQLEINKSDLITISSQLLTTLAMSHLRPVHFDSTMIE